MGMTDTKLAPTHLGSRAVLRRVEAGSTAMCSTCGQMVKFAAKEARTQVIANVYVDGRWARVEHFHAECYQEAGSPYGQTPDQVVHAGKRSI